MIHVKSLKNKISLINIAILAVVLFGYTALVYVLMHSFALRQIDRELTAEAQEISDLLDSFISRPTSVITTIQSASSQVIMRRQLSYAEARNDALTRRILETVDRYELRDDYVVLLDPSGPLIPGCYPSVGCQHEDRVSGNVFDQSAKCRVVAQHRNWTRPGKNRLVPSPAGELRGEDAPL